MRISLEYGMVYRIAFNCQQSAIAGRPCTYCGMARAVWYDIPRAIVDVDGTRWNVARGQIIACSHP